MPAVPTAALAAAGRRPPPIACCRQRAPHHASGQQRPELVILCRPATGNPSSTGSTESAIKNSATQRSDHAQRPRLVSASTHTFVVRHRCRAAAVVPGSRAHRLDERHQDVIRDLGEQLIGRRRVRLVVAPSWHAGQVCSGGAAGLEPPDASGAGAILSSQHSGHSTCGRPCRPCPCSHTKYAAPATSSKLRPPPKGSPGALGMRRCIAVHLSLDKAARPGTIAGAAPSSVTPSGRLTARPADAARPCGRPASQRPDPAISHQGAGQRQSRYAIGPGHSSRTGSADLHAGWRFDVIVRGAL